MIYQDLASFEKALDRGILRVRVASGNYWSMRRIGQTRLWKREVSRWAIPVKYGWRGYHTVTNANLCELEFQAN